MSKCFPSQVPEYPLSSSSCETGKDVVVFVVAMLCLLLVHRVRVCVSFTK